MAIFVTVIGTLIAGIGVFGFVAPKRLMGIIERFRSPAGLWYAVGVRLVIGILLVLAAADCRLPTFVNTIGIFMIVAVVVLPIMGQRRFNALIDWWTQRPSALLRLWTLVAGPFGGLLIYAGGWPA